MRFATPAPSSPSETRPNVERKVQVDVVMECHDLTLTGTSSADPLKVEIFDDAGLAASKKVNLQKLMPNPLDPGSCPIANIDGDADTHWGQKPLLSALVTNPQDSFGADRQDGKCKKCIEFVTNGSKPGSCGD